MSDTFTIKIQQFEGPFDLLLFFIERDELDIHDIPISKITEDFLDYIKKLEQLNIDVASEFILVAATLMRIKAKLLIPRKEIDEEGNEIDPREELVQRLLEYKQYKSVLEDMRTLEKERASRMARGNLNHEIKKIAEKALVDVELQTVTLYSIMRAFERVLKRLDEQKEKVAHQVQRYNYTIKNQQKHIFSLVLTTERVDFENVFGGCENRIHAIVTFLAMLELLNLQRIKIINREGVNAFWIMAGNIGSTQEE